MANKNTTTAVDEAALGLPAPLERYNSIFQQGEGTIIRGSVVTGWEQTDADVQAAAEAAGLYRPAASAGTPAPAPEPPAP